MPSAIAMIATAVKLGRFSNMRTERRVVPNEVHRGPTPLLVDGYNHQGCVVTKSIAAEFSSFIKNNLF
jgi:hypothetical protein